MGIESLKEIVRRVIDEPLHTILWIFGALIIYIAGKYVSGYITEIGKRRATQQSIAKESPSVISGSQADEKQEKTEYRDYINLRETYELPFDDGYKTRALILADGTVCRMDTQLVMEVTDALRAFDTWKEDHPLNLLIPVISARVHQLIEASTFAEVRNRRKEFEQELLTGLQGDFQKRGFKLDSFIIGAVEPIGRAT